MVQEAQVKEVMAWLGAGVAGESDHVWGIQRESRMLISSARTEIFIEEGKTEAWSGHSIHLSSCFSFTDLILPLDFWNG